MPDGLEGRLRWWFGGEAVVLVATGAYALLVSDAAAPAQGDLQTAPVKALLAAATATFALLGVLLVRAPRRRTHLMPPFVIAPAIAGLVEASRALRAWSSAGDVTTPAVIAASSLLLALGATAGWLALWRAPRPGDATARRDAELLGALLDTMLPPGDRVALDGDDPLVRARVVAAFAARATPGRPLLRMVLRALDVLARIARRRSFVDLDRASRESLLASLATSRLARLRALAALLEEAVVVTFWSDPRVRVALGDDPARVETLLDAGPNAAAHRARREAAERAAAEALAARLRDAVVADTRATVDASLADSTDAADAADAVAGPGHGAVPQTRDDVTATAPDDAAPAVPSHDAGAGRDVSARRVAASARNATARAQDGDASPREHEHHEGPAELAPRADDVPFDRPWTLGVPPQEPSRPVATGPVLRVARSGGPTRP